METFNKKIYGLSISSWIIIVLLVVMFYLFSDDSITSERFSGSNNSESNKSEATKDDIKVYNFNTKWCGYSVRFQPEWDEFAAAVKSQNLTHVKTYDIKCDNEARKQMCVDYDIPGFPTVIIERNGVRTSYEGPRKSQKLLDEVNKN